MDSELVDRFYLTDNFLFFFYIFTLFNKKIYNSIFPLQRGHSNPLKIKGNIHVKAALSFWMKCGEYHKIQT